MKKIEKILLTVFVSLFFLFCAFFAVGMLLPGASDAAEGKTAVPRLIENGQINDNFGDEFENWFSKNFAFRSYVVDGFSLLREKLFHTGNDQVIVGKDGFLFFQESADSYTGLNPMTAEELDEAADALLTLQNYADEHGARFLFVCAPNKASVYGEKMPDNYRPAEGKTDCDRFYAILREKGVSALDLRETLQRAKEDGLVYHKRDTHWNGRGASVAFSAMMNAVDRKVPNFGEMTEIHDFAGDLDALLYPGKPRYDDDYTYDFTNRYAYTSSYSNPMNMTIKTRSNGTGRALVFRDSFGNALIPYFASAFEEADFERANPYKIDLLEEQQANLVVVLIAERNLRDLIGCDSRIHLSDKP